MKCEMFDVVPGEYGEGVEIECSKEAKFLLNGVPACEECANANFRNAR